MEQRALREARPPRSFRRPAELNGREQEPRKLRIDGKQHTRVLAELSGTSQAGGMLAAMTFGTSGRTDSRRHMRMSHVIRDVLSRALLAGHVPLLVDDRGLSAEVTTVDLSADLRRATVAFLPPPQPSQIGAGRWQKIWQARFDKCKGELRRILGERVRSRGPPELSFVYDKALLDRIANVDVDANSVVRTDA